MRSSKAWISVAWVSVMDSASSIARSSPSRRCGLEGPPTKKKGEAGAAKETVAQLAAHNDRNFAKLADALGAMGTRVKKLARTVDNLVTEKTLRAAPRDRAAPMSNSSEPGSEHDTDVDAHPAHDANIYARADPVSSHSAPSSVGGYDNEETILKMGNLYHVKITHATSRSTPSAFPAMPAAPSPAPAAASLPSPSVASPVVPPESPSTPALPPSSFTPAFAAIAPTHSWDKWHRIFGHISPASIKLLKNHNMVEGLNIDSTSTPSAQCETCNKAKSHMHRIHYLDLRGTPQQLRTLFGPNATMLQSLKFRYDTTYSHQRRFQPPPLCALNLASLDITGRGILGLSDFPVHWEDLTQLRTTGVFCDPLDALRMLPRLTALIEMEISFFDIPKCDRASIVNPPSFN
ncbi:hypothetical protein B0H13DRAFT_1854658 [Mycena leptocephala]|nr:hypothetical protein B0H13DRAFT_1854658 [Mycena leptocephala]